MEKDFGFELIHMGINSADENEGKATAELISMLFGFPKRDTGLACFVNEQFEVMYFKGRGTLGHFGIGTDDIEGAVAMLESKGIEFEEGSKTFFEDGKLKLIYAKTEIGGFAFHLTQKG